MPKKKSSLKPKPEGSNNVTLATKFQTDYETEAAEVYVQQAMRKAIKRGETKGGTEGAQIKVAPEGGESVVWGVGSTFNIKDVEPTGTPISAKTIERDFENNIKRETAKAKSVFKHWEAKGYIQKGKKFESLPLDEKALVIDLAYQLPTEAFKGYKKLAAALSSGVSPSKKNVKKELEVSWKNPKLKKKVKDKRRNEIRKDIYTKFSYTN